MSKYAAQIEKLLAQAEQDGFERGWAAARAALDNPNKMRVGGASVAREVKKPRKRPRKKIASASAGTVQQRVLEYIGENPGNTGAKVIQGLGDVNGRTVRTMLRRLRQAEHIEKRGEGWFRR